MLGNLGSAANWKPLEATGSHWKPLEAMAVWFDDLPKRFKTADFDHSELLNIVKFPG